MAKRLPVGPFRDQTFTAGEDLSSKQYLFIKLHTDGTAKLAGAAGVAVGILQNKPVSGEQAVVRTAGESYLVCNGSTAIAVSDLLASDSSSNGVKEAADRKWYGAIAREALPSGTAAIVVDVQIGLISAA